MKYSLVTTISIVALLQACATSAPSNYELNRRSGLDIAVDKEDFAEEQLEEDMKFFKVVEREGRSTQMPARTGPVIEKIWAYDQIINDGNWMQGTWIYIEVEPSKWLPEVE